MITLHMCVLDNKGPLQKQVTFILIPSSQQSIPENESPAQAHRNKSPPLTGQAESLVYNTGLL